MENKLKLILKIDWWRNDPIVLTFSALSEKVAQHRGVSRPMLWRSPGIKHKWRVEHWWIPFLYDGKSRSCFKRCGVPWKATAIKGFFNKRRPPSNQPLLSCAALQTARMSSWLSQWKSSWTFSGAHAKKTTKTLYPTDSSPTLAIARFRVLNL